MLSSLASLLDSFRIPNRRRRGFNIFSRRRRRQTSSLRCQGIPGLSLQETLAHEPLEQRRLLAVDVSLAGSVLTVSFDDASDDAVSVAITSEGYDSSGANVSSGTGTITKLVVQDSGTARTSNFTLSEVGQVLSGGLSIGSVINTAVITTDSVDTGGGDVLVESGELTLDANIVSGEGSQTYDAAVVLASDVNLTTSTGVPRDMEVVFQGTVDSDDNATPRTLNVHSEAIYFYADVGSQSPLNDLVGYTVDDKAERGQFYQSVHTTGNQTYQAGSSSGDIEFNGNYIAGGDIELLGEGTFGVVLSLAGDTSIDVGTGEFSVQKGSSVSYPGGNIVSEGTSANLTITAGNITVPAGIGVASAGSSLPSPELNEFTINGIGTVGLNTPQVLTSGDFYAEPQIRIYQDTTLLSGAGEINLSSGVNNDNNGTYDLTLQTGGDIVIDGDLGATDALKNLAIGANGTVEIAGNISTTEDIEIIAQGDDVGVIGKNKSGVLLSGSSVESSSGDINITALGAVANGTGVELDGGIKLEGQKIEIHGKADGRGVHFDNYTTLIASDEIVVEGESTNSNTSFKNYEGVRLNQSSSISAGTDLTINGTTPAGNAVSLQANTTLTATNNLSINASFTGSATNDRYGFAAWSDVVMTADNLLIEGSTTGDSSAKSIGFDDNNNVTGHSSVHFIGDSIEHSYKGSTDLYVNGNGSLVIESENPSHDHDVSLEKVNFSSSFTSARIGKTTNTGNITVGSEGLNISGPIDIYGGQINLNGVIKTTSSDAPISNAPNITINGANIAVGANVSADSTAGDVVLSGATTLTDNVTFSGKDVALGGLDGGNHSVTFDATLTTIDAHTHSVSNIVNLIVTGDVGLNGTIATTGNQSYGGDVGVLGNTTLTAGSGAISLGTGGEVVGETMNETLTLGDAVQTGDVTLGGGSEVTLGGLNIGAGAFNLSIVAVDNGAVTIGSPVEVLNNGTLTLTSDVSDSSSVITFADGLNATEPSSEVDLAWQLSERTTVPRSIWVNVTYTGSGSGR